MATKDMRLKQWLAAQEDDGHISYGILVMAQEDDGADELLRVAEASRHEEWQVAADGVANFRALEIAEEQRDAANARAEVAFRHADEREAELVVVKQQFELALAELNQQRDAEVAQMLGEVKQQQQAEMAQVVAEFARGSIFNKFSAHADGECRGARSNRRGA